MVLLAMLGAQGSLLMVLRKILLVASTRLTSPPRVVRWPPMTGVTSHYSEVSI